MLSSSFKKTQLTRSERRTIKSIAETGDELSRRGLLYRILWRANITQKIQLAYKQLDFAFQDVHVRLTTSLCASHFHPMLLH